MRKVGRGYNERLFSKVGPRKYLHSARFYWLRNALKRWKITCDEIIELGCFDGKLLNWLDSSPRRYVGVDANWEGGLDIARKTIGHHDYVQLVEAASPSAIADIEGGFNLGVSMETLEHVPPEIMKSYLEVLAEKVDGYVLLTVPNEIGIIFAAKWMVKKIFLDDGIEIYTLKEYLAAMFGRTSAVERNQHKGFNYKEFRKDVSNHFDILAVDAIPFRMLPLAFAFNIGFVCRSKTK